MSTRTLWQRLTARRRRKDPEAPVIIKRSNHKLSRRQMSHSALQVLKRLHKGGYAAYLVGGGVRDILLKRTPKDFDIATDATPEEVRKLFRNSRLIGRRFRLAHVYFRDEIIEVSTFRANSDEVTRGTDDELPGMIKRDNTYGTIEEDAWRRDFTVNALYYNIEDYSLVDYVGGLLDLKKRVIRMIGDPTQRFHEDPVRLLRAIRLSAKLNFSVEEKTESCVFSLVSLLEHVSPSRLFDEFQKLFFTGHALASYEKLCHYRYFKQLFPHTVKALESEQSQYSVKLLHLALRETDRRFAEGKSLNPGFLLSVLLWPELQRVLAIEEQQHDHFYQALHAAMGKVLRTQSGYITISKRLTGMMRAIWTLQYHLMKLRPRRLDRTFHHRYFRAAFDFLLLRVQAGESYDEQADWWRRYQEADSSGQRAMVKKLDRRS